MNQARHRNGPPWAWLVVGLIGLAVVVETVVLAVMASLLSLLLAIFVPLAVLVAVVVVVRGVRRNWAHDDDATVDEAGDDDDADGDIAAPAPGRHARGGGASPEELTV
jgi:hypothetical protein